MTISERGKIMSFAVLAIATLFGITTPARADQLPEGFIEAHAADGAPDEVVKFLAASKKLRLQRINAARERLDVLAVKLKEAKSSRLRRDKKETAIAEINEQIKSNESTIKAMLESVVYQQPFNELDDGQDSNPLKTGMIVRYTEVFELEQVLAGTGVVATMKESYRPSLDGGGIIKNRIATRDRRIVLLIDPTGMADDTRKKFRFNGLLRVDGTRTFGGSTLFMLEPFNPEQFLK